MQPTILKRRYIIRIIESSSFALGLFFVAVSWATWPVLPNFYDAIPTGDSPTATVPQLNCWIMWWNMSSLLHGFKYYWHAPFFYPAHSTLAFSEPLTGTLLFAPLIRLFGTAIPAYNALVFFTLVLNGVFARKLLVEIGCTRTVALFGGLSLCFHPLALQNLEAVQLAAIWPCLWCISLIIRFTSKPTVATGSLLGLSVSLQCFFCMHHLLFWCILLAIVGWLALRQLALRKAIPGLLAALATCVCLAGPIVFRVSQTHAEYEFTRSEDIVRVLSANYGDWLTSQNFAWTSLWGLPEANFPLLPGACRVFLAGLCFFLLRRRIKLAHQLLFAIAAVSVLLSFGARLSIGQFNLWEVAAHWFSPLGSVRSPYRFAYFAQMAILLLASISLDLVVRKLIPKRSTEKQIDNSGESQTSGSSVRRFFGTTCVCGLLLLLVLEVRPPQSYLSYPPSPSRQEAWVKHIQRSVPWDSPLLCLPVAEFNTEADQQRETTWMMYATLHTRPIVNGYSGFSPPFWLDLRSKLREDQIDDRVFSQLRSEGIRFLVLRTDLPTSAKYLRWLDQYVSETKQTYRDDRYSVYEIVAGKPTAMVN